MLLEKERKEREQLLSRVAESGRACEVFVGPDVTVEKGAPIHKHSG